MGHLTKYKGKKPKETKETTKENNKKTQKKQRMEYDYLVYFRFIVTVTVCSFNGLLCYRSMFSLVELSKCQSHTISL